MSGVDVLAVLDNTVADLRGSGDTGMVEQLLDARGAVAELIDAAAQIEQAIVPFGLAKGPLRGLAGALARCRPSEIPTELNVDVAAPRAPGADA